MDAAGRSLAELRRRIDEIDGELHDLLIKRTEVAREIGAVKRGQKLFIRPAREAEVLRRLIKRHRGPFPKAVIVRIWREIFGAVTSLQGSMRIAIHLPENGSEDRALASDHFGSLTPVVPMASIAQVLTAVAEDDGTLGVLPLPQPDEPAPWWPGLARDGERVPRIIARLPFAAAAPARQGRYGALAVGLLDQEETGQDASFLVAESAGELSRSRMREILSAAQLSVIDLQSRGDDAGRWLHLVEVEGCIGPGHASLARLLEAGEDALGQAWAIGGYANPFSAEELEPDRETVR